MYKFFSPEKGEVAIREFTPQEWEQIARRLQQQPIHQPAPPAVVQPPDVPEALPSWIEEHLPENYTPKSV